MNITGIIWLRDVVYKLWWKHHITTNEVEEVFANEPRYKFQEKGNIRGEDLYAAYGRTDAGRYLTVFFICKFSHEALIVTARDMFASLTDDFVLRDRKERRRYVNK